MTHLTRTNKIAKDLRTAKYRQRVEELAPIKDKHRKRLKYDSLKQEAYEYFEKGEDSEDEGTL